MHFISRHIDFLDSRFDYIDRRILADWAFVSLVLGFFWMMEGSENPSNSLKLVKTIFKSNDQLLEKISSFSELFCLFLPLLPHGLGPKHP